MKLQEQLFRKIKAQGKSIKTAETYWHYCEDYLLRLKHKSGNWIHPSKAGRLEIEGENNNFCFFIPESDDTEDDTPTTFQEAWNHKDPTKKEKFMTWN